MNIEYIKTKFLDSEFGKNEHKNELSVSKKEDVMKAIQRAYNDSQPRTIKGHGKINQNELEKLLETLCNKIIEYFNLNILSKEDYDKWHADICKKFLEEYNKLLAESNIKEQKYGKAQKIVNMTFKYLYCYSGSAEKKEKFKYCHMALDSYTLNWFWNNCNQNVSKSKIEKWTKLEYLEDETVVGSYNWIQRKVRDIIEKDELFDNMTPLQAEFWIWNEEKLKEVLKSVYSLNLELYHENAKEDIIKSMETLQGYYETLIKKNNI